MKKHMASGLAPLFVISIVFVFFAGAAANATPLPLKAIKVAQPAANAGFSAGQAVAIAWTSLGFSGGTMRIRVVPEVEPAAAQVIVASTANDGAYSWTPATGFPGRVWIEVQATDGQATGKSGLFTIAPAQPQWAIYVTRPLANSSFPVGQAVPIAWNCTGQAPASVKIRLVPQDAPQNAVVVAASTANDGSYSYTAAAAFAGKLWFEVGGLDGRVLGKSSLFAISPAGIHTYTFAVNRTFHGGAWGEFCDGLQYLGNGFTVHAGSRMTIRKNLTCAPAAFSFLTRIVFPNCGCPDPENEARVNGTCYPFDCGFDPAVREKTFSAQELAENGNFVKLRLLLHGTSTVESNYQISGTVEVTIAD